MVEKTLELARNKADAAEVYLLERETRPILFENNQLKYVQTRSSRALSLRVIHRGRIGFASTTDLSQPDSLVQRAIETAQFGQEARFEFPRQAHYPQVAVFDDAVADFTAERGIQLGRDAIDRVLAAFDDVQCYVELTRSVASEHLANTSGLDARARLTGFEASLAAVRVNQDGILWVSDGESSRALVADFDRYTAKVIADIRQSQRTAPAPAGPCPVLFTARALAMLLQFIETAVNGKLVQKGASPLTGRLGEQVLGPEVDICDDATRDFGDGSAPFDAEGVSARNTPLFRKGRLENYLFDLQTAGTMGAEPTGNAARSFAGMPRPEASNLVLAPGTATLDGMLADIQRGLLVDEVIGGGQSNVLAGEFSVNVALGFLVQRGQVVGRVKDCMIAGNVFDLFTRIRAMGSRQETHGPTVAPPVCFDGVHVAGGH